MPDFLISMRICREYLIISNKNAVFVKYKKYTY